MTIHINPDLVVQQELAQRGVDSSVGVFGSHYVKIGKASPIRLDQIQSASAPYAGVWTAVQIRPGLEGVRQTAEEALRVLLRPGPLDAARLLGFLKAGQTHLGRLAEAGELSQAQKDDGTWVFTQAVRNLSNSELATAFQVFASAEMDLLQTALQREGEINREARDARKAAEQLFDLQALVLRESANRAAMAQLADMRAAAPNDASLAEGAVRVPRAATEQYGSAGGQEVPLDAHDRDLSAQSLGVLIETAASSATERERSAGGMAESLQRRSFDDVTVKQIGDVMRSKELTINMPLDTFLEKSSILNYPGQPIDTLWSLKERQIEPKSAGYQQKRDVVELVHFPELKHAQSKGRTRPVYGAVNFQESVYGAANALYGHVTIVLKPEVARRATFTVNDSFHTVALTVDRKRRENFFALFGGEAGIPHELKVAVANPESPERKALEEWFDRMEQSCREGRRSSHELAVEGYIPKIVRDQCNENLGEDQAIIALVLKCFADPSATRKTTATHDNIESLLPHLGQANSGALAQAAKDRAAGRDAKLYLVGTAYLEAQIHGPVVPERDIAEIRINLAGDPLHELTPTQQQAARDRLEALSRQTGIRIVYVNTWTIDDTLATNDLSDKTKAINAAHHDNVAIDRRRDEYLADFEAKVAGMVKKIRLEGLPEGMDFVLRGKVLDRIRDAFLRKLQEYRTRESWQEDSASMVEDALDYVLRPIADEKLGLLKAAAKLEYENPQQKQAFVDMLLQAGGRITNAQVPLVHRQATAQAALLRTWAAAEPPPSAGDALAAFAGLPAAEGADPHLAAQAAIACLFADVPPPTPSAMQKLLGILDSAPLRGMTAQIETASTAEHLVTAAADAGRAAALAVNLRSTAEAVARRINASTTEPRPCIVPLSAIQAPVRNAIRQIAPAFADALDAAHPAHPPFPAPANAAALPQNKAQRKQFLLGQMETYRDKELVSERGRSVHGRGHIIRAYIYATAFCNIMKEQGIAVDRNAVILGITGHDLGRGGLGHDRWEAQSAQMTNQAIRQAYGENTAGEAWEQEVADSIVGVEIHPEGRPKRTIPVSNTLEAQLLQSADSLDIGRTGEFDQYFFDFLRDKNGTVHPEAQAIRDQLADEANLLQRLTNPLCAQYPVLFKIGNEASNALMNGEDEKATELQGYRDALDNQITNQMIAQAGITDNEAFINGYEDIIRDNPKMFPLLHKYYINGE